MKVIKTIAELKMIPPGKYVVKGDAAAELVNQSTNTVAKMIDQRIMKLAISQSMKSCGRYHDDREIIDRVLEMREEVRDGADPEEVLYEEGFEPDYVFDLI